MAPLFGVYWSKLLQHFIFVALSSIHCVQMSTNVAISNWTLPGDKLAVSCSVSTYSQSDQEIYSVHLICPLIDSISCYVNCDSQCVQEIGGCANMALKNVFYSCNYVRSRENNKIDLYYQLNIKSINIRGPWLCQYGGIRSSAIIIDKYSGPVGEISTTTSTKLSTKLSIQSKTFTSTVLESTFLASFEIKIIIIIIASLAVSVMANIILITVVCVTRRKFLNSRRKLKRKESAKDPTETTSMLTRSSTHQQMLTRSNCSRTPSLDSPSFRESIATYLPEGSTVIPTNITSGEPHQLYLDQCGRLFSMVPAISNYAVDGADVLSHNSSGGSTSPFRPVIHGSFVVPQRMQSYGGNWTHMMPQHQESFISTRACSSQQQIYVDSNDESGLGSQSFSNSAKQKHGSFHSGSGKVDLILDCGPNNLARPH